MTAERDALFRLLTQLADGLDDLRAEERRHVKALERARKWVEALQLLFRMFEKALPPGPEATPIPSAEQLREFLRSLDWPTVWAERNDPNIVAVRMWLEALAGEEPETGREPVNLLTES